MGTKCAPPYACLVVGYKEEIIKFIKFKLLKKYLDDTWTMNFYYGQQCWTSIVFLVCLNNLHPSINYTQCYTYEKAKVTRDEKINLVQILNFLDVNVILNSKNEISTDVCYKDTNTLDYLLHGSAHLESCK